MSSTTIVRSYRVPSASKLLDALAGSLTEIKEADGHTDAEIGAILHKGEDQARKYRTAIAEMSVVSFFRGAATWNGRFANDALDLIGMKLVPKDAADVSPQSLQTRLCKLMLEVSSALEDGDIDDLEIARMKRSLIEAGEAIDAYRGKAA